MYLNTAYMIGFGAFETTLFSLSMTVYLPLKPHKCDFLFLSHTHTLTHTQNQTNKNEPIN